MNKKLRWITETAVLLALLICLQWVGSTVPVPMARQLLTGTFVNCVLAVAALYAGRSSGITIALISPVVAFMLGIAANALAVPAIMVGNVSFVIILSLLAGKGRPGWLKVTGLATAALTKFALMYVLAVGVFCGLAGDVLRTQMFGGKPLLDDKLVMQLNTMFAWPQLVTALTGGALALLIVPVLRKALHK